MILGQFELRNVEYVSQKSVIVILHSICGDIIKQLRLLQAKYKWLAIFLYLRDRK